MKEDEVAKKCVIKGNVYIVPIPLGNLSDRSLVNLAQESFCSKCSDAHSCTKEGKVIRKTGGRASRVRMMRVLSSE